MSSGPHLDPGPSISAHAIGQELLRFLEAQKEKREHTLSRERPASVCAAVYNMLPPCARGNYVFTCTQPLQQQIFAG